MLLIKLRKFIITLLIAYAAYFLISFIAAPLLRPRLERDFHLQPSEINLSETERISVIEENENALIWRLRLIESAEEEIILSSFDFRADETGTSVMAALYNAAERGVKIRLLLDGFSNAISLRSSGSFNALLSNSNTEIKYYNKINLLLPWKLNYRMHDKYLIIDQSAYVLGGRNTNDLFLGKGSRRYSIDREILVYNEQKDGSLNRLMDYFEYIWDLEESEEISIRCSEKSLAEGKALLKGEYEGFESRYPESFLKIDWENESFSVESVDIISNSPRAKTKSPVIWNNIINYMKNADDIFIQSPYLILGKQMYNDLNDIGDKNPEVLTNSLEGGVNLWGVADYLNNKEKLLETGITIYEYLGEQSLHTKTILLDEDISIIGSYNLDMRSTYLSTETMLIIKSRELNQALRKSCESYTEQSRKIKQGEEESYGDNCREIKISWGKKAFYAVVRVLILPIRQLL
ncbi:phospholipase D family protein [Clostridiaceae bacterium OttesenSCG-928-D20]|nr:phospholipase D family protein [Clostridiaceae bacterium OttesenSCG-928-D20]